MAGFALAPLLPQPALRAFPGFAVLVTVESLYGQGLPLGGVALGNVKYSRASCVIRTNESSQVSLSGGLLFSQTQSANETLPTYTLYMYI